MDIDFMRGCIEDVIDYENLHIKLPKDKNWTSLYYNIGPLEAEIALHPKSINLRIFLGEYDRNIIGPGLESIMAASIGGPGLSIKSEMKPRSKFYLNLDLNYASDIEVRVVTDMIMQTAWMSINLLKHGVDSGGLLRPDSSAMAQYGLWKPFGSEERDSRHRNWFNNDAGVDFLIGATNRMKFPNYEEFELNTAFDPRAHSFMSVFHDGKEVVGLGISSEHEDGIQYRVGNSWKIVPENINDIDNAQEVLIAREFFLTVLELFDQGSKELLGRTIRGDFSPWSDQ